MDITKLDMCNTSKTNGKKREPLPSTQTAPSLDEKFARKRRREGEAGRDGASSHFFSFPWSIAPRHESIAFRARLYANTKRRNRGRQRKPFISNENN